MLSLAAIVVLAVGAGILMVTTTVLVYRYLPSQRERRAARRTAARAPSAFDDIEKADAPTRKVQVRQGRVVSWHSAINEIKGGIERLRTPKPQNSRPESVVSVAPTIDLEKQIQAFRRDYARAKELESRNPGAGASVNGIQTVPELRAPSPTFRPKILSAIDEAENPADTIKESSWETYNGHRGSNHPLSSYLGKITPSEEKDITFPEPQRPAPVKASSSAVIPKARNTSVEAPRPSPRRAFSDGPQEESGPKTIVKPLRLDTLNLGSLIASISADGETSQPLSAQSALFKSPINEVPPVAPRPRKPSKLDLRGSYSQMDYGFPSPPPTSTTMASPISPKSTRSAEVDRSSSITEILQHGDFMDLESVISTPTRPTRPSSAASRSTTHSRKSRASYRVRKRPPPLPINEPVPSLSEKPIESVNRMDSATLPSPSASDIASIISFQQAQRASKRTSGKSIMSNRYSGMTSPTVTSPPAFRVPLYAGKATSVTKPSVVSPKNSLLSPPVEIEPRRVSDSSAMQRLLQPLSVIERPTILRTQSSTIVEITPAIKQNAGRSAGNSPPRKRSPPSRDMLAAASSRPNPARSASHAQPSTPKRPSLKSIQRNASAPCVHKALPPLPPTSPRSQHLKVTVKQAARSSNSSTSSRSSAGLSAHPVSAKPAPKVITNPAALQVMTSRRISPPMSSATITSPEDISLTSPYGSVSSTTSATKRPSIKQRRSGLDRIASAITTDAHAPEAKARKFSSAKVISPATLAARMLPPATLAAKLGAPVVSSREVAPSPRNSGGSTASSSAGGNGIGSPPVPHAAVVKVAAPQQQQRQRPASPASPAVSVISTPTPAKRRAPKLPAAPTAAVAVAASRRWETESAVSPLSVDFPMGVKA